MNKFLIALSFCISTFFSLIILKLHIAVEDIKKLKKQVTKLQKLQKKPNQTKLKGSFCCLFFNMIPPNYLSAKSKLDEFIEYGLKDYSKRRNFDNGPENRSNVSCLSPFIKEESFMKEK